MAKTEQTKELEKAIWNATSNQGTFGCFEVTIGWFGGERVDYLTYSTEGEFRCYEIKATKSDFYSKAQKTFCGHFNYFVMPQELYEQVKSDIPPHVGVYTCSGRFANSVRKAKRVELSIDEKILKDSLIRSLSREVKKQIKSGDLLKCESYERQISGLKRDKKELEARYNELRRNTINDVR